MVTHTPALRRVHVTGGPGSGKTTLTRRIAQILDAPLCDLDVLLIEVGDDIARLVADGRAADISRQEAWVSEGVYFGWTQPLLDRADLIVCLDTPWLVALCRIISRHVKAEVSRDNRFPGWRRFLRFLRWSYRYYHDGNPDTLDALGVPGTRSRRTRELERYREKLVMCRTQSDVDRLVRHQLR